MKWILILTIIHGVLCSHPERIRVRSHGRNAKTGEKNFEAVVGLNVSPRNRLRVISRSPNDAAETLAAAEAAGLKAKELKDQNYRDLDSFETSLIPVSSKITWKFATKGRGS